MPRDSCWVRGVGALGASCDAGGGGGRALKGGPFGVSRAGLLFMWTTDGASVVAAGVVFVDALGV